MPGPPDRIRSSAINHSTSNLHAMLSSAVSSVVVSIFLLITSASSNTYAQSVTTDPTSSDTYCPAYPDTAIYRTRTSQITLSPDDDWQQIIATTEADTEILLQDGVYELTRYAVVLSADTTIRSASGDRDAVILKGPGYARGAEGWMIGGDNVTIADLTVTDMRDHAIAIKPELGALLAPHIYGVHLYDIGTQHIKLSPGGTQNGIIACSSMGYTLGAAVGDYNGAIDLHEAVDWTIRDNLIYNIEGDGSGCLVDTECGSYLTGPAILAWANSSGTITERNHINDSVRGIAYGLGRGHSGGVIRDNYIHQSSPGDAGIELQSATGVLVENNRIILAGDYPGAIEYRHSGDLVIRNNTLTATPWDRGDNSAPIVLENNVIHAAHNDHCDVLSDTLKLNVPPMQWVQASLPCLAPDGSTLATIIGDDINGLYGIDWIAFNYDPAVGYTRIDVDEPDQLPQPGTGFWIIHAGDDTATLDLPTGSYRVPTSIEEPCLSQPLGCAVSALATIEQQATWNLSGSPLDDAVTMNTISVTNRHTCTRQLACSATDKNTNTATLDRFFAFTDGQYQVLADDADISPWSGFWSLALQNDSLLFWPQPAN